ncbi:hypothetical protein J4219_05150 [Candidatus Woesearchaeota archaeon]|nr:hypothetical protein [Candidatus Woesearchaeota archaeon]
MSLKTAVIFTGPTTTGKTDIATALAKRFDGEIINSDRLYVYSFLRIGSGLSDTLESSDVARHLYGICGPSDILCADEYVRRIEELVPKILSRKKLPIIEGCSSIYNPALIESNRQPGRTFHYSPIIALRWPSGTNLRSRIEKRLEQMFEEGLLQEATAIFNSGYKSIHPIEISVVYNPLMKYLDGNLTLADAKEKIIDRFIEVAHMQLEKFETIPEIQWIEANPNTPQRTLQQAIEIITGVCR